MKTPIRIAICFFFISTIISCKKEDIASKDPGSNNNGGANVNFNVNESVMLDLVNQVRASGCTCGTTAMPAVPALSWNDQLATAAYNHSVDMATNNFFSHTNLQGKTPGDRITAAGYVWSAYGENIAEGYTTEQLVMDGWLHSEGHCKNIMSNDYKEIGVGRSANYWTMDLGSK